MSAVIPDILPSERVHRARRRAPVTASSSRVNETCKVDQHFFSLKQLEVTAEKISTEGIAKARKRMTKLLELKAIPAP